MRSCRCLGSIPGARRRPYNGAEGWECASLGMSIWIFYWKGGGGNSVCARTRAEALRRGNSLRGSSLRVDESTLRKVSLEELEKWDHDWYLMTV